MDTPLVNSAFLGSRIILGSGLLNKYPNLNRNAYRVLVAVDILTRQEGGAFCRNDLIQFMDKHMARVYPSDLSTILLRLSREGLIRYSRWGAGTKNKMRIKMVTKGMLLLSDLEFHLQNGLGNLDGCGP